MGWEDPLEEGMVQPTSVFLPENPMDKRSLVSYSPLQGASSAHGNPPRTEACLRVLGLCVQHGRVDPPGKESPRQGYGPGPSAAGGARG